MEEELKSIFDEITKKIAEEEDNAIAKAFTLHIEDLLKRNGINPILTKVEAPYEECSSANEYQLVSRYGYIFERLDIEHDKKIIADERERIVKELEEMKKRNPFIYNVKDNSIEASVSRQTLDYVIEIIKK